MQEMTPTLPHIARKRRPAGFTLTELLTVIAIIGILSSISIPVVGSVRESARAANCTNNLRQIANAFLLYAYDHGGRLPDQRAAGWAVMLTLLDDLEPFADESLAEGAYVHGAANQTATYATGIWRCDSAPAVWQWTYLPNYNMWRPEISPQPGIVRTGRPLDTLRNPSRFPLMYDRGGANTAASPAGTTGNRPGAAWHRGGLNTAFADGSVRSYPRDDLIELLEDSGRD